MLGISTFPSLLPTLAATWNLSNADAGWINGVYFAGLTAAAPLLVATTDRVDARRIYLCATALGGLSLFGFAVFAEGFWTAMLFRGLGGVALAGSYMPGLKALTDRLSGTREARAVAFYTSSFGIGVSLSFLVSGALEGVVAWPWVFGLLALGAPISLALAGWALTARPPPPAPTAKPDHRLLDFRPVFRNREALGYILAYSAHNWELFALRGWLVAYLAHALHRAPEEAGGLGVTLIVTVVSLSAVPASILGGELALRFGRRRVVGVVMTASAVLAVTVGLAASAPFPWLVALVLVYGLFVSMDSAAITTGSVTAAPRAGRGAVMAMHSFIGFAGAFAGPLAFGLVLDLAAGLGDAAWTVAFAVIAAGLLLGPLALHLCRRVGVAPAGGLR